MAIIGAAEVSWSLTSAARHVPDDIQSVPAIPRTLSGKILEVPVKRILMGADPETGASRDSLANPEALDWFVSQRAPVG